MTVRWAGTGDTLGDLRERPFLHEHEGTAIAGVVAVVGPLVGIAIEVLHEFPEYAAQRQQERG